MYFWPSTFVGHSPVKGTARTASQSVDAARAAIAAASSAGIEAGLPSGPSIDPSPRITYWAPHGPFAHSPPVTSTVTRIASGAVEGATLGVPTVEGAAMGVAAELEVGAVLTADVETSGVAEGPAAHPATTATRNAPTSSRACMAPGRATTAQGSPRMVSSMRAQDLDPAFAIARGHVESGRLPFAILGVANRDGIVRHEAVDAVVGPRIGANAVCLLASITKPIVATAVLRLAQEGRFSLTAPLGRWLPELDAAGIAPFTAWHVLTHTTGFPDIDLVTMLSQGGGRADLRQRTIAAGQATPPGSTFRYASFTFDLLTDAIERALDTPFDEVLREAVLTPLGLTETGFDMPPPGPNRAPVVYGDLPGSMPRLPGVTDEYAVAAFSSLRLSGGGLWSTARDLLRFGRAFLRGGELDGVRILGGPLVDLMTREVTVHGLGRSADRLTDEHYAIGWGKPGPASAGSPSAFGHGGVTGTRLWVDPEYDLVLVFLSGTWSGADPLMDDVQLAVYGTLD
jgi:CubicO group peptidase (beta-lactamase class C family)